MKRRYRALNIAVTATILLWSGARPIASVKPSFKFDPPHAWHKVVMKGADAAWMLEGEASLPTLVVSYEASGEAYDFNAIQSVNEIVEAIEDSRAAPYRAAGVREWKVEGYQVTTTGKGFYLEMRGHYISPGDHIVQFLERDYFLGSSSYTVVYSENEANSENFKSARAIDLLNRFHPTGAGT
jgi:hypothetical protein